MLTFSDFVLFLYEEKCLVNYFDNIKKFGPISGENKVKSTVKILMECPPIDYLSGAFEWNLAQEGHYFWANINIKWKSLISNER